MKNTKINSLNQIKKQVITLKKKGKVIVTTNGVYDIVHPGHVRSLNEAKNQGDVLIVGINSDKSVKKNKSSLRPINDQDFRTEVVAALEFVDLVFIFNETTPNIFLEQLKPDIHANGAKYGKDCIEKEVVEKNGGKIYLLQNFNSFSTTKIIQKIIKLYGK